jgi:hypothetical protein
LLQAAEMAMKPPDEGQPADDPHGDHGQIQLASEWLAEGQHDERHGEYAEYENHDFGAIQAPRR